MVGWSIAAFRQAGVAAIVVASPSGMGVAMSEAVGEAGTVRVVDGGETRSASVANALALVETELVAIHDAARPLLTPELVDGVIAALEADPAAAGAIAAVPVTDTIKRADRGVVAETLDRDVLWAAQTPQVFDAAALRTALAEAPTGLEPTDEAMLVEGSGGTVLLHPTGAENLKVTTPFDLALAERLLAERRPG